MTRVYLHTFGCKANQYDTEVVRQALESAGATVVDDPAAADAAVVNSCAVTHVSEAKMRGLVRRIARRHPGVRTVVMGCAAALDDGCLRRLPGVVAVVRGAEPAPVADALRLREPAAPAALRSFRRGARAWLKIQDGCNERCTFCVTTIARGVNRSRPVDALVAEAATLAATHEEIVLTGVHIGSYGTDLDEGVDLARLVERLVTEVPRVRFRLSSVEATEVDERLADLVAHAPDRVAPHLHAPLQSGSDRVLKRMGRHWYTASTYRARLEALAERVPTLGLGADVIVGFPGETDRDHAATIALVDALPFTYLHVFPYSQRPEAAARRLGPPVPPPEQRARSAELRSLADAKGASYRGARAGGRADVVLLRRSGGWHEGLTEDYLPVRVATSHAVEPRLTASLRVAADGNLLAIPVEPAA